MPDVNLSRLPNGDDGEHVDYDGSSARPATRTSGARRFPSKFRGVTALNFYVDSSLLRETTAHRTPTARAAATLATASLHLSRVRWSTSWIALPW